MLPVSWVLCGDWCCVHCVVCYVVCCMMCAVGCLLLLCWCGLVSAYCLDLGFSVCCLLFVGCNVGCLLFVVCSVSFVCVSCDVWCLLLVSGCALLVGCCL